VKCGDCAENCPAEAIKLDDYPKVDLDLCIRCYCCQELCSFEAVDVKKPFLGKLFFK
jgi:MinD superfamily P-loop ATPase